VRNSPKVSLCATPDQFYWPRRNSSDACIKAAMHLVVMQGMSKESRPRYRSRLNIIGCFALLHAIKSVKIKKGVFDPSGVKARVFPRLSLHHWPRLLFTVHLCFWRAILQAPSAWHPSGTEKHGRQAQPVRDLTLAGHLVNDWLFSPPALGST